MTEAQEAVVVVGAGVCGLAVAHVLAQNGRKVVLLERNQAPGGLARSFRYGDYTFDIGPHRFHTENRDVGDYIRSILGNEAISFPRISMVHFLGKYYQWPLRPSALLQFPPRMAMKIAADLALNPFQKYDSDSFEDYVLRQYGRTLYENFFLDYSEKFLKLHPGQTHADWAKVGINRAIIDDKVQMRNVLEVVRSTLSHRDDTELQFLYPRTGMQTWCDMSAAAFVKAGGQLFTGVKDFGLKHDGQKITGISYEGHHWKVDQLVWTAPLHEICNRLEVRPPRLKYLAMVMFNAEVKAQLPHKFQWCYFGDKSLIFNRISNNIHFSEELAPWGCCGLEIEVTCMEGDEVWENPERLKARIIQDLIQTKLIYFPSDVAQIHIEKIRHTYPIYSLDYRSQLKETNAGLKPWRNLILAGRTGQFWYNNMDHSIGKALSVAGKLLGQHRGEEGPMFGRENVDD